MRTLVLPVYRRCNQACVFCAVADELDGSPVPPASLREAIDGARARGFDSVCLTGGEPTLAPQLIRALAYAHGIGLHTAISTNGRLLADVEKVKRLEATGLDAVHVALHAATPGVHQDLTGGDPIAHEQVVTALRHCVPRFHTTVRMVLTTRNLDEVTGVCALARELGVHRVDLRCVRHEGATASGLVPTPQQALDAWRTAWSAWAQPGGDFAWHGFRSVSPAEATPQPPSTPARDRLALLEAGLVDEALLGGLSDVEERLAPELVAATGVG
ncbi:MAG: radical SAM protein, partial [Alphaproteobacteria bacterium]|nr:radical SAM protein [Alphaproteobacteria bacterium]